jgi:hypothetical protein
VEDDSNSGVYRATKVSSTQKPFGLPLEDSAPLGLDGEISAPRLETRAGLSLNDLSGAREKYTKGFTVFHTHCTAFPQAPKRCNSVFSHKYSRQKLRDFPA